MEEILERCCGLDVHKDTIVACVMIGNGRQKHKEIKTFSTFTCDIHELAKWLKSHDIQHVAVESTGNVASLDFKAKIIQYSPCLNVLCEIFNL